MTEKAQLASLYSMARGSDLAGAADELLALTQAVYAAVERGGG